MPLSGSQLAVSKFSVILLNGGENSRSRRCGKLLVFPNHILLDGLEISLKDLEGVSFGKGVVKVRHRSNSIEFSAESLLLKGQADVALSAFLGRLLDALQRADDSAKARILAQWRRIRLAQSVTAIFMVFLILGLGFVVWRYVNASWLVWAAFGTCITTCIATISFFQKYITFQIQDLNLKRQP